MMPFNILCIFSLKIIFMNDNMILVSEANDVERRILQKTYLARGHCHFIFMKLKAFYCYSRGAGIGADGFR